MTVYLWYTYPCILIILFWFTSLDTIPLNPATKEASRFVGELSLYVFSVDFVITSLRNLPGKATKVIKNNLVVQSLNIFIKKKVKWVSTIVYYEVSTVIFLN